MEISVSRKERIAIVTFESGALSRPLREELWRTMSDLDGDTETDAVILTGKKRVFMSGADLREVAALADERAVAEFLALAHRLVAKFCHSSKLIVAAINGYCLGGGLELALACDLRLAVSDFRDADGSSVPYLGFPEARLGLVPALGGAHLAAAIIGNGRANELLMSARPITAERAYEIGLVNALVPRERLLQGAEEMTREILINSALAVCGVKRLLQRSRYSPDLERALSDAREAFARCCASPETAARIARSREEQRIRFRQMAGVR
jgi:enoyl-CoA hydratase/carnithine racemase